MKFLDTNIFIRFLAAPATDLDRRKQAACLKVFQGARTGEFQVTTSESVVHETLYVLCSPRQYKLSHPEASARLRPLLSMRSLHLEQKRLLSQALDLFATHTFLDFADAMSIALTQAANDELISYDSDFDKVPGVKRYEP